ncbi:cytochrome P450 81Q32-like [Phoenix dactylifera]|uniref:Cytochrome P450 81Q32-like n=1 Tax=Phoenix dactylifera TaxID=42345 RepID=A0A8B8ZJN6_PHODC|nr:cytochrome P450 81Q32-like [Phoenix dactylifera]
METATFYYCAVLFLALLFTSKSFFQSKNARLRSPPTGPLALPVVGHLHLLRQPIHRTLSAISARHGPLLLLRFGSRPVLLVSSPSAAEDCFTVNDITFANRPQILSSKHFGYDCTTLGASPYGPHWRNLRRIATLEIFSPARVAAFSASRAAEVRSLLRHLFGDGDRAEFRKVEMKSRFSELTFNVAMQMIAGRRYYGAEATEVAEEGRRFRRVIEEAFLVAGASTLEDFLPWVRWAGWNSAEKRMARLAREMDELFQEMVEERRKKRGREEGKTTIIDVMLEMQEAEPGYYTDEIIKGIILNLISAGTDTSAGTMEWALALLLNHPEALKKAKAEIDMQVGHARLVTDHDLRNLHYLQNVIKETLRLFPAGPLLLPHESSEQCVVQGYSVPRGTMLLVNAYAIQRDPQLWTNPFEFRPERFDEGEGEGYKNIPFGSGRRRCPGEGLAMRTMGLALGSLIQCFEWKRTREEEVDMTEGLGLTMPKAEPLEALYKPCGNMTDVLSQI